MMPPVISALLAFIVEKYRIRPPKPPSPAWKAFLTNHVQDLVALDFFVVPTVTHKVFFVLLILAHERRRVVHLNITDHPTAQWTAQQVVDAFPWEEAPRDLLRDRDRVYGAAFRQRVQHMGIEEVMIAPRVHGRIRTSSGSLGVFAANAWTR
jgi:putative transposase